MQTYITQYSDLIATELGRTLAYEKMRETVWCLQPRRYYVSHWPVKDDEIETIEAPGWPNAGSGMMYEITDYMVEEESGKIELFGARDEPIVVTYSGGYKLPDEAPPALQAAVTIMIRA